MNKHAPLLALGLLSLAATSAQAVEVAQEQWRLVQPKAEIMSLGTSIFGDRSSIYTGVTEFTATDVSIPGNNTLPVSIGRRFAVENARNALGAFGDWDYDIPYMHGIFSNDWQVSTLNLPNKRCSVDISNPSFAGPPRAAGSGTFGTSYFQSYEYWYGNNIHIPGSGDKRLMVMSPANPNKPNDGASYHWVTNNNWVFSCLPSTANGVSGEAFLATSPDGTKYQFDWFTKRHARGLTRSGNAAGTQIVDYLGTSEVRILPTKISDRFGNYVVYTYDSAYPYGSANAGRLLSISSNDGRQISLYYNSDGKVSSVSDGSRSWTYIYNSDGKLEQVTLPDESKWKYALSSLSTINYISNHASCADAGSFYPTIWTGQITHPSGAVGNFTFQRKRHGRTYVPKLCYGASVPFQTAHIEVPAIIKKEISGPGIAIPMIWSYDYGTLNRSEIAGGYYDNECTGVGGCPTTRDVTITDQDQRWERYTLGIRYGALEGKTLKKERGVGSSIFRSETNTYQTESNGQPYPSLLGTLPCYNCDRNDEAYAPIKSLAVSEDGTSYSTLINSYDNFSRPLSIGKSNSLGFARTDISEYHDDLNQWVLGQVKRQYNANTSFVMSQTDYNAQALPWKTYKFGKLQQELAYYADGTLASVTDGRNYTTTISNWKRGIPQQIQFPATPEAPAGATQFATVNNNGWITSLTDENNYTHGYGYDAMGRLASIVYPSGDNDVWESKGFEFRPVTTSDWMPPGISVGQWRQYEGQGNYRKFTYFDAMWRPTLVHEYDATNVNPTLRSTRFGYDANGRQNFRSYPTSDLVPPAVGMRTFYDALDRIVRTEQDSEHGVLTTNTEYLAGLQMRVTNPRNLPTTTGFMAWDQPGYDLPLWSSQPEGKVIEISRHPQFGWPLQLKQRSADNSLQANRQYVYDGNAQLCKTIEPETGVSVMGYDAAGNLEWQVSGLPLSSFNSTTDCQHTAAAGTGLSVMRTYDARNRLFHLAFPGGLGNQIWTYEKDNLPASVTAYNGAGHTDPVVTAYTYNKRRLLTGESLSQPSYTWGIGYQYDTTGNLRWQSYPTGLKLDFAPNALGQATQARNANQSSIYYASGAQYFPNGALKQFTYGNGIVHTMSQNARQLPARVTNTGNVLDFGYDYDKNGNPTTILDLVTGTPTAQHRWMSYDGLDRLTTSASAMYGGSDHTHRFTYDALDNMESWKHAGVKDYADYVYDTQNRLTSIRNTAGATVVGIGYDLQGNLSNKNGQLYEFDYGNRLRNVQGKESYRYDGLGRRVQAAKADGSQTTLWQYGQTGQMLFSTDWDGPNYLNQKTHESVYLAGSLIATIDHDWPSNAVITTKYQHTDALGSPVAVTNEAGAVIERNNYEPYGAIIGNPTRSGIGYTGHVMDGGTGLTYMQQRYYDQSIGRFLSVDPVTADVADGDNFNRYWYANHNPYKFVDPDGRQAHMPAYDAYMRHYYRNGLNDPPRSMNDAKANSDWEQMSDAQSVFHQQGENGAENTKWVDGSGHNEAVYDGEGNLVTDTLNGGTYNYGSPDDWFNHLVYDVIPYIIWGNGPIEVSGATVIVGEIETISQEGQEPEQQEEPRPPENKLN